MTTTTIPAGITQLPHRCWYLIDDDGQPVDNGECVPHYPSRPDRTGLTPAQLDTPCWTAIAACGAKADDYAGHYETADEAFQAVANAEFNIIDGVVCCDRHGARCPEVGREIEAAARQRGVIA